MKEDIWYFPYGPEWFYLIPLIPMMTSKLLLIQFILKVYPIVAGVADYVLIVTIFDYDIIQHVSLYINQNFIIYCCIQVVIQSHIIQDELLVQ